MLKTVEKLLEIARSQLGYKEKATNSQLDDFSANAGSKNYTKYARDLAEAGYYQASKQGQEWCDMFVDWCFLQLCGNKTEAEAMICQTGLYGAGCAFSAQYYKNAGRYYTSSPQPGDQIFFGDFDHTGIIEKVENGIITTIEGNSSNQVQRCTYSVNNSWVTGFGRPRYEETQASEPAQDATAKGSVEENKEVYTMEMRYLKKGCTGEDVKALQILLIGRGYSCGSYGADGEFGSATDAAVRKYQQSKGLDVDGIAGPATLGSLLGK